MIYGEDYREQNKKAIYDLLNDKSIEVDPKDREMLLGNIEYMNQGWQMNELTWKIIKKYDDQRYSQESNEVELDYFVDSWLRDSIRAAWMIYIPVMIISAFFTDGWYIWVGATVALRYYIKKCKFDAIEHQKKERNK